MIRYFIDRQELTHVREICELLNRLKIRIMRDDYSDPRLEFNDCKEKFDHIINIYEIARIFENDDFNITVVKTDYFSAFARELFFRL